MTFAWFLDKDDDDVAVDIDSVIAIKPLHYRNIESALHLVDGSIVYVQGTPLDTADTLTEAAITTT